MPLARLAQVLELDVLIRETDCGQRAIDGRLTATAPIEDLRVGDTVRFSTTLVERSRVMKGNGEALIDLPAEPAPIAEGTVRVLWPTGLPVKWKAFGPRIAPVDSDKGAYHILTPSHPLVQHEEMPEAAQLRLSR